MTFARNFLRFWYDFIVGDDWVVAAGVVLALIVTGLLTQRGLNAWWTMPAAVAVLLVASIARAARRPPQADVQRSTSPQARYK